MLKSTWFTNKSWLVTSDKGGGKWFCVCLSVCLWASLLRTHAWIWVKCCVSTDVGTWTNWLTFEPSPDHSPDDRTGLLSSISYKHYYVEFYVGKIPCTRIGGMPLQRDVVLKWFCSLSRRNTFVGGTCSLASAILDCICHQVKSEKRGSKPASLDTASPTAVMLIIIIFIMIKF